MKSSRGCIILLTNNWKCGKGPGDLLLIIQYFSRLIQIIAHIYGEHIGSSLAVYDGQEKYMNAWKNGSKVIFTTETWLKRVFNSELLHDLQYFVKYNSYTLLKYTRNFSYFRWESRGLYFMTY